MSKAITLEQIRAAAAELDVPTATLLAVMDVECRGSGFLASGEPVILFEPHVYWRELGKVRYYTKRKQMRDLFPDICHPKWQKSAYKVRPSHQKLYIASALHWEAAHASCSWGLGQVMGNNWKDLGYASIKEFVDAMHESEAKQLEAMCRFIRLNNLVDDLQRHDWAGFARGYNGSGYLENRYDEKLAIAYKKHKHTK